MIGTRSITFISSVLPAMMSGIDIARPTISSGRRYGRRRAVGGAGDGDDVVDAHHQVGDQDGADRRPQRAFGLHLAFFARCRASSWTPTQSSASAPSSFR